MTDCLVKAGVQDALDEYQISSDSYDALYLGGSPEALGLSCL